MRYKNNDDPETDYGYLEDPIQSKSLKKIFSNFYPEIFDPGKRALREIIGSYLFTSDYPDALLDIIKINSENNIQLYLALKGVRNIIIEKGIKDYKQLDYFMLAKKEKCKNHLRLEVIRAGIQDGEDSKTKVEKKKNLQEEKPLVNNEIRFKEFLRGEVLETKKSIGEPEKIKIEKEKNLSANKLLEKSKEVKIEK